MFGRLRLTSKESKTFVLDAAAEAMVNCPEWALVGKVLTPNPLHIETIKAVLRPAWGNPRGMQMRHMGPKLFLAEFETKADMLKIMNGSPWVVGRNVVLLKEFDPRVAPSDMVFDRLKLWVRIFGLPFALMNSERGGPLAGMIGEVEKVECDERGRAWGEYLRVRINVDITEPFMRCVAVESSRLNRTVFYEVKYEKLPIFCFSCGFWGTPLWRVPHRLVEMQMANYPGMETGFVSQIRRRGISDRLVKARIRLRALVHVQLAIRGNRQRRHPPLNLVSPEQRSRQQQLGVKKPGELVMEKWPG
jgi:hypothetical protein